jgi:DNA-binding transcriptional regulator YdaS (Cro superfamily)
MESAKRMIDRAARICGNKTKLAHHLGVAPQRLNDWEAGRRPMPDAALIELAHVCGTDPRAEIGRYRYEWHEKKRGAALAGIAVAGCLAAALLGAAPSTSNAAPSSRLWGSPAAHYAHRRRLDATLRTTRGRLDTLPKYAQPTPGPYGPGRLVPVGLRPPAGLSVVEPLRPLRRIPTWTAGSCSPRRWAGMTGPKRSCRLSGRARANRPGAGLQGGRIGAPAPL